MSLFFNEFGYPAGLFLLAGSRVVTGALRFGIPAHTMKWLRWGRFSSALIGVLLWTAAFRTYAAEAQRPRATVVTGTQYEVAEWSYETKKAYPDPFNDLDVDVIITDS